METWKAREEKPVFSLPEDVLHAKAFRLYERRKDDNQWNDGSPLDEQKALEILAALEGSTLWDTRSDAVAYSCAVPPAIELGLAWSTDLKDRTKSVWFCYGNHLFEWKESVYQVPHDKEEVLGRYFPQNK